MFGILYKNTSQSHIFDIYIWNVQKKNKNNWHIFDINLKYIWDILQKL